MPGHLKLNNRMPVAVNVTPSKHSWGAFRNRQDEIRRLNLAIPARLNVVGGLAQHCRDVVKQRPITFEKAHNSLVRHKEQPDVSCEALV